MLDPQEVYARAAESLIAAHTPSLIPWKSSVVLISREADPRWLNFIRSALDILGVVVITEAERGRAFVQGTKALLSVGRRIQWQGGSEPISSGIASLQRLIVLRTSLSPWQIFHQVECIVL